ncbi:MAG TPA: PAS domain-containing protein [Polaromonas sp.]|uniref:PAS domain-containing protein n=1 Tax=Polaromonas sp. TaxID=1869339 RepID=UPI002D4C1ACD|nr:PAS domain-containing protein [Polaromonas sp.]HYW58682.1 PAS domain-containing protein [Polaromonas sp.]
MTSLHEVTTAPAQAAGQPTALPAQPFVLSVLPADQRTRRATLTVMLVSLGLFLALAVYAKVPLAQHPMFIPMVQTALIINSIVTATLLIGQMRVTQSRALLVLACGYVFAALMAFMHMLSFPGVFSPKGLLTTGPQTTAYLFIFWHTGFPLAVMAFALRRHRAVSPVSSFLVPGSILAVVLVVALLTTLASAGHDLLPAVLTGNQYSTAFDIARYGQWFIAALAVAVLWRRKPHSILDLWILVVLCGWFFEIGLVAIFNAGRYDLGFYAGRVYALLASSLVLIVLLTEQSRLYASLLSAHATALSESALRESRDVLSLAMQAGRMGAWTYHYPGNGVWWSTELEEIFGLSPGGAPGTEEDYLAFVHPEDRVGIKQSVANALSARQDFGVEFRFQHASGEWRWMDWRGRAAYGDDGQALMLLGIGVDITARKRGEEAARDIESRFRVMADGMPQLAWMASPDGWIHWYNKRWYAYSGTTEKDMEGWGWQSLHDPDMLPAVMAEWQRAIATGEQFEMVFPLRGVDGVFRPFLTRASPLKDASGAVMHWFGTNTDITAQRDAEEVLRVQDRRKDEFLATLAHELRNPLAPIRNAVAVMARVSPLPERADWALQIIDRQSRHLARLVDDLLDVSRITQGKINLQRKQISLLTPLRDAVDAVRSLVDAAGHELEVSLPAESLEMNADATRISQALFNLLSNAVKFTPPGGRISIGAMRQGQMAKIWVRDNGVGLTGDNAQSIFEMFSQVDSALERTQGGLGIGLALVRGLVELHGGTVQGYSEGIGHGSEFTVYLPLSEVASQANAQHPLESNQSVQS